MKFLLSLPLLLLLHGWLAAQPPLSSRGREETAQYLWRGLTDSRERLEKGAFRAHGRRVDQGPPLGRLEDEVEIFSAFDYRNDLLRFDRTEPIWLATTAGKPPKVQKIGGKYARTPEKSYCWFLDDISVVTDLPTKPAPPQIMPFDVRALGLLPWISLKQGLGFAAVREVYVKTNPDELEKEKDGLYRLVYNKNHSGLKARHIIWLDEKQGFSPVRLEYRYRFLDNFKEQWSEPKMVSEATWVKISGVWVPRTFRIEERHSAPRIQSYELAFEWDSVNQRLPGKLFTNQGFDLTKGTSLLDQRLHKPIVTEIVGGGELPFPRHDELLPQTGRGIHRWRWLIASTSGCFLVLSGWLIWRRFRRAGAHA